MLKYIHQFVQSFLREASKSRPKSRKSSRSSVDLTKDKSTVKPEILAIEFNNEGQEVERSKEILELKRTYSLLMKKFVNPNLDLTTDTKTAGDINILSLKGKQELIKSTLNKIFNEIKGQQKQLEGISNDSSEANVKPENEELSVGWSGQRTSKLAANPMVETSSQSNNTASALFSFPENQAEPSSKNTRQADTFLKHRLKESDLKEQNIESKQNIITSSNYLVGSDLRSTGSSSQIKPEHINGNNDTNLETESFKETIMEDKICSRNIGKWFPPKENLKENLQPPLHMELNSRYEINDESSNPCRETKYLTHCNKQKNINIVRSITKVDKSKIVKSDSHSLKEKNNDIMKVVKSINSGQKKLAGNKIDKQHKTGKDLKLSVDKPKLGSGMSKNKERTKEKEYTRKNEQSASSPLNPEDLLSDSMPNNKLPPVTDKTSQLTDKTVNNTSEKVELSMLKSNTREGMNKEALKTTGETPTKPNFEKEQNQTYFKKSKIEVCELKESLENKDQAERNVDKITNETVNKKLEPITDTYWNLLSNKLLKTSNDAQQFINNLEISSWKSKAVSSTDALTKDVTVESKTCDKQSASEPTNESSKQDNQNIPNRSNVKANCGYKLGLKGIANVKTQKFQTELKAPLVESKPSKSTIQNQHSLKKQVKPSTKADSLESQVKGSQTSKSKSIDFNSAKETLNSTKPTCNFKHNYMVTKSSNDLSNDITDIQKSSKEQSDSNISPRKTAKNTTENNNKYLKNGLESKSQIFKTNTTACMLSENHQNHKDEPQSKEVSNIDMVKNINIIPEGDGKIKKLVKRFKKLESNKFKQNVVTAQKICNKILNYGKLKKMPLYKLKAKKDKTLIHRVRKALRTKSDHLAIDKTLPSNKPTKGKLHSNISLSKRVQVNRMDSNIFPNVNINIYKQECMKDIDQPNTINLMVGHPLKGTGQDPMQHSSKIITEFDSTKTRKLHSKKEVCKPTKLQMYGVKRSIYTHSNPYANRLQNTSTPYFRENITEPNLASSSLMNVSRVTPINQTNVHPFTTPVRSLHTTVFRGKLKQLPRKKKSTVIKRSGKTKPVIADTVISCQTDESTANTSKSMENKLKIDPHMSTVNSLNNACPKDKIPKENSLKDVENQIQISDDKCLLKDKNHSSLLSSSVKTKTVENTEVLYHRSERDGSLHGIPNSKEDTLLDSTSSATPLQSDVITSSEIGLNFDLQSVQSSQGNEVTIESPKWRSKKDRLDKWKTEVECNSTEVDTEDKAKKSNEESQNCSCNVKTERIGKDENNVTFEKYGEKKELLGNQEPKSYVLKNINISNENVQQNNFKKEERDSTVCSHVENNMTKREHEHNKLHEDSVKMFTLTKKDNSIQSKNNNVNIVQTESNNEVNENKKKETSNQKVKEFESKLRVLESKLRALELRSVEKNNTENVLKTNAQKDAASFVEGNHVTIDENKTRFEAETKNRQLAATDSILQNKNKITNLTFSVKDYNKSIKKDQNDPTKEHLSQKVKNLELKLKSLEGKLNHLKEKPNNVANKREPYKSSTLTRSSKESCNPKTILNQTKNERANHFHSEKDRKLGNSVNPKINNVKNSNTDRYGTNTYVYVKPEVYLKHYLASNPNNFEQKIETNSNKDIVNNIRYSNNKSLSPPLQNTSSMKDPSLKNNNVSSVNKMSGKLLKQKLQPKDIKLSEISEAKKIVTHMNNKVDKQQTKNAQEKSYFTPLSTKSTQKINLSKSSSSISIPLIQSSSREAGKESKTSSIKYKVGNKDSERQNIVISTKKSLQKSPSLKVDKKMPLKRNSNQRSTLHEGLLKSSRYLKSVGPEQDDTVMNVIDKISSVPQNKFPSGEKGLKSPVFPQKLLKALNNLKNTPEKQNDSNSKVEWRGNVKSTELSKVEQVKDQTDSTSESSSKREITEKTFNSFDYFRPKRRVYDAKHPIEREKYGIEFLKKNEIILDKFYPKELSRNSTLHSLERNRNGKESTKFHKDSGNHLNTLITRKHPTTVKSIQK